MRIYAVQCHVHSENSTENADSPPNQHHQHHHQYHLQLINLKEAYGP